ncbi:hypothetical protein SmJEL517_g05337 [Synchytrium microbalum]|uniref:Trichome birefringence-like C-terminal domain-containing protein n=1 Tax=Synchytrium microbalum TaxID=1806994 RepID=A0A507C1C8_9FUNG|nr:uncharacterized protein SmJEL517_g05337 [Synchytrium microbalum]TPX31313.1 hypothetical protein SmJEL517_g05337 [Synchytrium microbalum]
MFANWDKIFAKVLAIGIFLLLLTILAWSTSGGYQEIPPSSPANTSTTKEDLTKPSGIYCPPWKMPSGLWINTTADQEPSSSISKTILKMPYDIMKCRDRFAAVYPLLYSGIWGFEKPFHLQWMSHSGCILHPVDGALWLETYRNKEILFFGDSLTQQVYISFVCTLEATLASSDANYQQPIRMADPDPHYVMTGISHGWYFPAHNITTTFFRSTSWTSRTDVASPLWAYARKSSLWIASDGAWYNKHKNLNKPEFFDLETLPSDLYAFRHAISDFKYNGTFITRSYMPVHFDTDDNEWQGPVTDKTCIPPHETALLNPRYAMARDVFIDAGWPFVDVYQEVLPLWELHRPPSDCRHWMHPGVSEWVFQALHHSMVEAGIFDKGVSESSLDG